MIFLIVLDCLVSRPLTAIQLHDPRGWAGVLQLERNWVMVRSVTVSCESHLRVLMRVRMCVFVCVCVHTLTYVLFGVLFACCCLDACVGDMKLACKLRVAA